MKHIWMSQIEYEWNFDKASHLAQQIKNSVRDKVKT